MSTRTRSQSKAATAIRSMCVVCGVDFIKAPQLREGENFPELWTELWHSFCISLDLNPSSWTGISDFYSQIKELPFCEAGECRTKVVTLLVLRNKFRELQNQLEGVGEKINGITNNISMTIINTHTSIRPIGTTRNSDEAQEDEDGNENIVDDLNVKKEIEKLRKNLSHRFNPKLILGRLNIPEENVNEQTIVYITPREEMENEMENESETDDEEPDFLRDTSDESEPETEPETEVDTEPESEPETEPEPQISIPVNINSESEIWMYQKKWPVQSIGRPRVQLSDLKTRFKCLTCGRTRMGKGNISTHIRQDHIYPNKFMCPVCGQRRRDSYLLGKHMQIHRAPSEISQISKASAAASASVPINRKSIRNPNTNKFWLYMDKFPIIRLGSSSSPKNTRFKCGMCEHSSSTETLAMRHIQRIHMNSERFDCVVCGQNNADDWCLRAHMKIHGELSTAMQSKVQSRREIEPSSELSPSASPGEETPTLEILYKGKWPIERLGSKNETQDSRLQVGNCEDRDSQNSCALYRCKTCGFTGRRMQGISAHICKMHINPKMIGSSESARSKPMKKRGNSNNNSSESQFSTYSTRSRQRMNTAPGNLSSNKLLVPY